MQCRGHLLTMGNTVDYGSTIRSKKNYKKKLACPILALFLQFGHKEQIQDKFCIEILKYFLAKLSYRVIPSLKNKET